MARPLPAGAVKPTVLFAKNADVDRFNQDQLKKIGRDQFSFTACSSGSLSEPFAKSFGAPVLWLAVGAQVMHSSISSISSFFFFFNFLIRVFRRGTKHQQPVYRP